MRELTPDGRIVRLECEAPFDPVLETDFDAFPPSSAVFALFTSKADAPAPAVPYIGRTHNLRRRLSRLLGPPVARTKRLNLRAITRRIAYQPVGSTFEGQWLLLHLSRFYDPERFARRLRLKPPALIKVKLRNRFPRCYVSNRLREDGSRYFGPFPSRAAAEKYTGELLDLFKLRRCVPNLDPDPAHPGCIYSQMKMCMAPCFKGCTDEEYAAETHRVISFLVSNGASIERELAVEREDASSRLEFERAARAHARLERLHQISRLRPAIVRELPLLNAVLLLPGTEPEAVTFFVLVGGEIRGPTSLSLSSNVAEPLSLDAQLQHALEPLWIPSEADDPRGGSRRLPPWEHLSLLARWYYSSFRQGEIIMLGSDCQVPYARLVRLCRKLVVEPS